MYTQLLPLIPILPTMMITGSANARGQATPMHLARVDGYDVTVALMVLITILALGRLWRRRSAPHGEDRSRP